MEGWQFCTAKLKLVINLILTIREYTCICGNRWCHSYPVREHTLASVFPHEYGNPVVKVDYHKGVEFKACFTCLPAGTPPLGWEEPKEREQASPGFISVGGAKREVRKPSKISILDLEKDILG